MIMIIIVCRSLIIFVGKSACDAIGGTIKNQMDDAVAFKPDFVIQEAKDIVDYIQEKGTTIRLSVIIGWLGVLTLPELHDIKLITTRSERPIDTEFLNFRYFLNVTIFKYLSINYLNLGY